MKSAYELAMERLNAADPNHDQQLTETQKEELADLDNKYKAKIAERKIALDQRIKAARAIGNYQDEAAAQDELKRDIARIESDREAAKQRVREGKQRGA